MILGNGSISSENWYMCIALQPYSTASCILRIVTQDGKDVLTAGNDTEGFQVVLNTTWTKPHSNLKGKKDFIFTLRAPLGASVYKLVWKEYSFALYADDILADEDWPLGKPAPVASWLVKEEHASEVQIFNGLPQIPEESYCRVLSLMNYVPDSSNTGVGDCMPFSCDGSFSLFYLLDRRGHRSKAGLGAHQWKQIKTKDLKTWEILPMAVPITDQMEGSICTGSLIKAQDKIYAFYAVRMSDGTPARLTCAVSSDGIHFDKSENSIVLSTHYEPVSARDPKVFEDNNGLYHMLVTTSIQGKPYGGCLAHLTSRDLKEWQQREPFIVPGFEDQPECSDYFRWNDWYYLVFSNFATARYRISKKPFGPWTVPANDLLDSEEIQVPKTAFFGNRCLSVGFLARRPRTYAGSAVIHELFQRGDGTLGVMTVPECLPASKRVSVEDAVCLLCSEGRSVSELAVVNGSFRLQALIRCKTKGAIYGITIRSEGEKSEHACIIQMDSALNSVCVIRPKAIFDRGDMRCASEKIPETAQELRIDLIVIHDMLDFIFGDGHSITVRLDNAYEGMNIGLFTMNGNIDVEEIQMDQFVMT